MPKSLPRRKLVKIGRAANLLGVSIDTVRRWEKAGKLTAIKTPGGTRLFSVENLEKISGKSEPIITPKETLTPQFFHPTERQIAILSPLASAMMVFAIITTISIGAPGDHQPVLKTLDNSAVLGITDQDISARILNPFTKFTQNITNLVSSKQIDIVQSSIKELNQNYQNLSQSIALAQEELTAVGATAQSAVQSDISSPNLIPNSSFEASSVGQPRRWIYIGRATDKNTFITQEIVRSGLNSLKFVGGTQNLGILNPDAVTGPARDYNLTLYLKSYQTTSFDLNISFWNPDTKERTNTVTKQINESNLSNSSGGWQLIEYALASPGANKGKNWFPLIEFPDLKQGVVYIDDVALTEVGKSGWASVRPTGAVDTIGDGSIFIAGNGEIYPSLHRSGALGVDNNRFNSLYLTGATIDSSGNASLDGKLNVSGNVGIGASSRSDQRLYVKDTTGISGVRIDRNTANLALLIQDLYRGTLIESDMVDIFTGDKIYGDAIYVKNNSSGSSFSSIINAPCAYLTGGCVDGSGQGLNATGLRLQMGSTGKQLINANNGNEAAGADGSYMAGSTGSQDKVTFSNYAADSGYFFHIENKNSAASSRALEIDNASTSYGLFINQTGSGRGLQVNQDGAENAVTIVKSASGSGIALSIANSDNTIGLAVNKSGTGTGSAAYIANAGTGTALQISNTGSGYAATFSAGNVGIGTTTPPTTLSVYNSNESTTLTNFTQSLTNAGINIYTDYTASAYTPGVFWSTGTSVPMAGIWTLEDGSGSDLYFGTSNNYSTGITNNGLVLDQSGNVGIGTVAPNNKLEVLSTTTPQLRITYDTSNYATLAVSSAGAVTLDATGTGAGFTFSDAITASSTITMADNQWIGLGASAGYIEFDDQSTDEINFVNANVGIGTSVPVGLLDVAGAIYGNNTSNYLDLYTSGNVNLFSRGSMAFRFDSDNNQSDRTLSISHDTGTAIVSMTELGLWTINPVTTGTVFDFTLATEWTTGTIINGAYASSTTQTGDITGLKFDFDTNLTGAADSDITGTDIVTNVLTQTGAVTTTYIGYNISAAGALTQNTAAGTINWRGANITLPVITQTTGTVAADGLRVLIPASGAIVTAGTMNGINVVAPTTSGPAAGTLNGVNIGALTSAGSGAEYAVNIGAGWDTDINATTSLEVGIGGSNEVVLSDTAFYPATSDGNALGSTSNMWSDLFLASGGVINFNNGDVTLTHSTDTLTLGGGALTITGTEGSNMLTVSAGDAVISDGSLTVTDDDDATSFSVTNNTATTVGAGVNTDGVMDVSSTSLTTGNLVNLETTTTLSSGRMLNITSTSTALTSGNLLRLNWTPGSATTATGDLFSLNIGANGTTTGNLLNILDSSSSIFSVSETAVTTSLPTNFTASGDVSIAYDINMTNPTASYIKSAAPLYLQAGEVFNSSDLVLKTFNAGTVLVDQSINTTGSPTIFQVNGAAHTTLTASVEATDINFNLNRTVQFATGALTTQRAIQISAPTYAFAGASTLTTAITLDVSGAPLAGTNATITNAYALRAGGATTQVSASGLSYQTLNIPAHTLTVTGTTQVTSSTTAALGIGQLTITDSSAVTYDNASSLYIAAAPTANGSVTLTNAYALWVDAGAARFDGPVALGSQQTLTANSTTPSVSGGSHFTTANTTNPTLISNFTSGYNGQILVVELGDSVTDFDCTASNLNCGGADITTGATGDIFTFVYDGTNWNLINWMDTSAIQTGADIAEWYVSKDSLEPGDLVSISPRLEGSNGDDGARVEKTNSLYDQKLMGIVSSQPHTILGSQIEGLTTYPIALAGRVFVKVSTESGAVAAGDYLTSSSVAGVAMKATKPGPVIGKALGEFNCSTSEGGLCQGKILVFVSTGWANPASQLALDSEGNVSSTAESDTASEAQNETTSTAQNELFITLSQLDYERLFNEETSDTSATDTSSDEHELAVKDAITTLLTRVEKLEEELINNNQLQTTDSSAEDQTLQSLTVLGHTTLGSATFTDPVNIGMIALDGIKSSIDSLATLKIQPSRFAGIDILGGIITIDKEGNLITQGTITAKTIRAENFEAVEGTTAGSDKIPAGKDKIIITNKFIKSSSKIFVTATVKTGTILSVTSKLEGTSFTVSSDKPVATDTTFDFWIVN